MLSSGEHIARCQTVSFPSPPTHSLSFFLSFFLRVPLHVFLLAVVSTSLKLLEIKAHHVKENQWFPDVYFLLSERLPVKCFSCQITQEITWQRLTVPNF